MAPPSLHDLAFTVLGEQLNRLLANEPGTRDGDVESLHQMRVTTRRLRAALRFFEGALPEQTEALREEIGWLAGSLGAVRDRDIQLGQICADLASAELDEADRDALAEIVTAVDGRRRTAREHMLQALDSTRYRELKERLTALPRDASLSGAEGGSARIADTVPQLLQKRYRRFRKAARRIQPDAPPEVYHRCRIRAKQLRYAVELVEDLYGRPAARFARRLTALQGILGEHQDAYVARDHLEDLVRTEGARLSPRSLFLLGQRAERSMQDATRLRALAPKALARARGKAWRRLRDRMNREEPGALPR